MPSSRRTRPDGGGDNEDSNSYNATDEAGAAAPNLHRRDENAISFRHFLQQQSDVVPARRRPSRGASAGSVDLVDGAAMALPDFVQDHLPPDGAAGGHDQPEPRAFLPEGAQALPHEVLPSQRLMQFQGTRNGLHSLSNSNEAPSGNQPQALPDFLSDGPMLSVAMEGSNPVPGSVSSSRNATSNSIASMPVNQIGARNERDLMLRQIEQLTREIEDRDRSIRRLERDLRRQQNETSMLETAYLNAKQSLQEVTRRAVVAENRISELEEQKGEPSARNRRPKNEGRGVSGVNGAGDAPSASSHDIMEVAFSTEFLVGQLAEQVQALKRIARSTTSAESDEPSNFKDREQSHKPKPDGSSK